MSILVRCLSASMVMWPVLLPCAIESLPGLALANATSSCIDLNGWPGLAAISDGKLPMRATGVKSLIGS